MTYSEAIEALMDMRMRVMTDGRKDCGSAKALGVIPGADQLNQVFVEQDLVGARLEFAHRLIRQHEQDVRELMKLLYEHRLKKAGWDIDLHFMSSELFFAAAMGAAGSYLVQLSIGIAPQLFSLAAEIEALQHADSQALQGVYAKGANSLDSWYPWMTSLDEGRPSSAQIALDAALLIYFHELAHIIFGHCDYQPIDSSEARALELDADFNAGSMFTLWLPHLGDVARCPVNDEALLSRLARASFLVGVVFKALSSRSTDYHFPTVRAECYFAGGTFALERAPQSTFFGEHKPSFWTGRRERVVNPMLDALRQSSLKTFAGTEQELAMDLAEMEKITYPARNRLKDGPLRKLLMRT